MAQVKYNDPSTNFSPASYFQKESKALGALNQSGKGSDVNYNLPVYGNNNPFINFRQPAVYNTQWSTVNQDASILALAANVPLDRVAQQSLMTGSGVKVMNNVLDKFTYATQTMDQPGFNINGVQQANSDAECPTGYTRNAHFKGWDEAVGQQTGPICSKTIYPELLWVDENGNKQYNRKLQNEGGIGKSCVTNNDCGEGYECNNSTNTFGSNNQQTGYCAQTYMCGDGKKRYLGTPNNSLLPVVPSKDQNNNGKGYSSYDECDSNASPSQNCVLHNGNYFAVFPAYCPIPAVARENKNPQGALNFNTPAEDGFTIPAGLSNQLQHKYGFGSSRALGALAASRTLSEDTGNDEPMAYIQSLNGVPEGTVKAQRALFG